MSILTLILINIQSSYFTIYCRAIDFLFPFSITFAIIPQTPRPPINKALHSLNPDWQDFFFLFLFSFFLILAEYWSTHLLKVSIEQRAFLKVRFQSHGNPFRTASFSVTVRFAVDYTYDQLIDVSLPFLSPLLLARPEIGTFKHTSELPARLFVHSFQLMLCSASWGQV